MNNCLDNIKTYTKFKCIRKSNKETCRAMKENENTIFVYNKGSKKYGWRYSKENFELHFDCIFVDETAEWHKRLKRAIKCMEESGLWENIKIKFQNMLLMTWEDRCNMYEIYWMDDKAERAEAYKEYFKKFPFAFRKSEGGEIDIDTDYIWELSHCKLKSMYFGKYFNDEKKQQIKEALANKTELRIGRIRTAYDISFSYAPDKNQAWYSEEYKNCGNGHYYIALNANTALFVEDD